MRKALRWVGFRKPDPRGWWADTRAAWRELPATLRLLPKVWREIPGYFSDALDGWVCAVHHELDLNPWPVCATCKGRKAWPCKPYRESIDRIISRRDAREAVRRG